MLKNVRKSIAVSFDLYAAPPWALNYSSKHIHTTNAIDSVCTTLGAFVLLELFLNRTPAMNISPLYEDWTPGTPERSTTLIQRR